MADAIRDRVLRFQGSAGSSEPFESLALDVFAHQHGANPAYRAWCDGAGVAPVTVTTVAAIPAVPVAAFKELEFVCGTPAAEFRTSGTTGTGRGRHFLPDLEPYRAGALAHFARCLLPEGWKLRTLVLAPPPELRPHSSLSRMLGWVLEAHGESGSGWFVGASGLERDRLAEALLDAQRGSVPVLIAATSAALGAFLDYCDATGLRVALPGGSRLMDTGGQKGARLAAPLPAEAFQAALYRRVAGTLGIPPERCVNEYGMTELCSQAYDRVLAGTPQGTLDVPRIKLPPPWLAVSVVDPVTLEPVPAGASGLLRFVDLANVGSVAAVLTEDFGRLGQDGFILEGRPRASEARGCGLTFEELQAVVAAP
ncbi:MAG: hypothetical protein AAB152_00245 [Candidatus Coatesbacteria bacterium]